MVPVRGRPRRLLLPALARYPLDALSDTRPKPPTRSAGNGGHRKRTSPALIVVPLVLVLVAGGLVFFLTRGDGGIPFIDNGPDAPPVKPVEFKVRKARAVATSETADMEALGQQAESLGQELTPTLNDLFTNAFIDPDNWKGGDYTQVWDAFTDGARASAEQDVETLTAGATAGDVYDWIEPTKGSLEFDVLFDQDDAPTSVVVKFRFYALGSRSDGTYTAIVSHGQLFLSDTGSWQVSAFDVKREDRATESPAPPPPAPSASPS
jgi:hypothetical protein